MSTTKKMTRIANPIYDVVFRYMMEDNKVAKLVLSAIIDKEISELVFSPTEYSKKIKDKGITIIRMDFSARIKEENDEERLIIIEVQKAKFHYQIMRFRRYLGKQYMNPENVDSNDEALPIFPIYILGESFTKQKVPVIKVRRDYVDASTNEVIDTKHPFVEALTHDATLIQIPYLKDKRRTVLEQFLSIFDQNNKIGMKGHTLNINEANYPQKYHPVIRRLKKAIASPNIEDDMVMEDEIFEQLNELDAKIETAENKAKQAENKAKQAENKVKEAQKKADAAEKQQHQLIKNLSASGMEISAIAQISGISEAVIREILQ